MKLIIKNNVSFKNKMVGSCESAVSLSKRCSKCKKKSHILVNCSCTKSFCMSCRFPEDHECNVDYKEQGKSKLLKENPVIVAEKVLKI